MKVAPKLSLRPFLHRALQFFPLENSTVSVIHNFIYHFIILQQLQNKL